MRDLIQGNECCDCSLSSPGTCRSSAPPCPKQLMLESLAGPRMDMLGWSGAQEYPKPLLWSRFGHWQPHSQRVKPCRDPPTNQSCQPCAALDLCQPWKSHIWEWLLTAMGFKHPGTATAKICHQQRVCGTSGAQEGETGTGDSPRALFPSTAVVILGTWHNGECVCRGHLDPCKKGDVFFFKKTITTL